MEHAESRRPSAKLRAGAPLAVEVSPPEMRQWLRQLERLHRDSHFHHPAVLLPCGGNLCVAVPDCVTATGLGITQHPGGIDHQVIVVIRPLAAAFVLRGLKEFGEPTRKALIMDLSPEGKQASMFGLYYLLRDVVVSVAAFGGAFLWIISPATNFLAAFGFGALGTLWFALQGRDLPRKEDGRIRSY